MENAARNLKGYYARGVTLVELMITLVVMGITLSIAAPSFHQMIVQNTVTAQVNDFILAINVARSEASRTGSTVSLQAIGNSSNNEFGGGYCVVDDNPGNCTGTVIRRWKALTDSSTLNSIDNVTTVKFDSLGGLDGGTPLTFDLCNPGADGQRIYISPIGRARAHSIDDPVASMRPQC